MPEITVATIEEFPEGTARIVRVGNKEVAVFHWNDAFYAIENTCPHAGGSLGDGFFSGGEVNCPIHEWPFDITTGEYKHNREIKVETYKVEVIGDEVVLIV